MAILLGLFFSITLIGSAVALEFSVDSIDEDDGFAIATVKVTNDDAPKGYRVIAIDCTWLKNGFGVAHAADSITNLQYQDTNLLEVKVRSRGKKFDNAVLSHQYRNTELIFRNMNGDVRFKPADRESISKTLDSIFPTVSGRGAPPLSCHGKPLHFASMTRRR